MPEQRILMGVIGRPHGVRGLVHVHSYTADPADLANYNPLLDEAGRCWSVAWRGEGVAEVRDGKGRPLADRTEAERLVNLKFYVERHRLPQPDGDEFYLSDLVGLLAHSEAGAPVGRVTAIHDYGAGTSLEIDRGANAAPLIVPFTQAAVPVIDLAAGQLTVVPPTEIDGREMAA
jgi:16S rRNA processing protein RimM